MDTRALKTTNYYEHQQHTHTHTQPSRRQLATAIVLFLALAFAAACKKEKPEVPKPTSNLSTVSDGDTAVTYVYLTPTLDTTTLDSFDINSTDTAVISVVITGETATVICFSGETDYMAYAQQNFPAPNYNHLVDMNAAIDDLRDYVVTNDEEGYYDTHGTSSDGMLDLIAQYNTVNKSSDQQKTTGFGILFDGKFSGGASFGLAAGPEPTFGWFRNRASSARGLGIMNFLYDHRWWSGKRIALFLAWGQVTAEPDFSKMKFDNMAESSF